MVGVEQLHKQNRKFFRVCINLSPASANAPTLATGVAPPLPAGTQNILPYIESFFVTCEKLRPGQPDAVQDASTSDMEDASTSSGGQRSALKPVLMRNKMLL